MKLFVLLVLFVAVCGNSFASPPLPVMSRPKTVTDETARERLIGSFVKTFAKSYVATTNLQKFKEKNIRKILRMDEARFQRIYGRIYEEMIADLPEELKKEYGIEPVMTRDMAIARINSFKTKASIYKMINSIPNKMIAQHFAKHKDEFKKGMKNNRSADRIIDQLLEEPPGKKS